MKPRIVLDTNLYISAILFRGTPATVLGLAISEVIEVYISLPIMEEIAGVLKKKFKMKPMEVFMIIDEIKDFANIVSPTTVINIIKNDLPDNRILECAQEAKADYIISGDKKHLLSLGKFKNISILSAREFLDTYHTSGV